MRLGKCEYCGQGMGMTGKQEELIRGKWKQLRDRETERAHKQMRNKIKKTAEKRRMLSG